MIQQRLGVQIGHRPPRRTKGYQNARDADGGGGFAIGDGIADQDALAHIAAHPLDRGHIGRGIGFARRQCIRPDQRAEQIPHPKSRQQFLRQTLGLVRADAHTDTGGAQTVHRIHRAIIHAGVPVQIAGVMLQKDRMLTVNVTLGKLGQNPLKPKGQHRPPAAKRSRRIRHGVQRRTMPQGIETGIRRVDQIATGIGQRAIKVENHGAHVCPLLGQIPPIC